MTPDQADLLKKAEESLYAAKVLFREEIYSFAVSRAYYTMFYLAEAFLEGKSMAFSKHSAVIGAFGKHFAKSGLVPREFHRFLLEAHKERLIGDYDIRVEFTEEHAKVQINRAEAFLTLAQQKL